MSKINSAYESCRTPNPSLPRRVWHMNQRKPEAQWLGRFNQHLKSETQKLPNETQVKSLNGPQSSSNFDFHIRRTRNFGRVLNSFLVLFLSFSCRYLSLFAAISLSIFGLARRGHGQGSSILSLWLRGPKKRIGSIIGHQMLFCA